MKNFSWLLISVVLLFGCGTSEAGITTNVTAFWNLGDAYTASTYADSTGRGNNLNPWMHFNPSTVNFTLGATLNVSLGSGPQQVALASMKGWGKWDRMLTPTEKAALYSKEYWPFSTTTSLQDAVVYYPLTETGGATTYADATGRGNTLTASGTTVRVAGPLGSDYATKFNSGVYLYAATVGTDLQSSQKPITIAGWVNLTSKSTASQQGFWCSISDSYHSGFNIYYDDTAADRFQADFDAGDGKDLTAGAFVCDNILGSPSTGTWYLMIAEFDVANNRGTLSLNNGTANVLNYLMQPTPTTGKIGNGSQFRANAAGNWPAHTSGWDWTGQVSSPINGNCNLDISPNADVSIGNKSKTVWGWFKASDYTTYQTLGGFYGGTGATTDWVIQLSSSALVFTFGNELATVTVPVADTNWHFVVAWFDKTANKIYIDLDHEAHTANTTGPTTPHTVSNKFRLGSDTSSTSGHQFTGILNAWGIADGTPSQGDLDTLWNSGNGWAYTSGSTQGRKTYGKIIHRRHIGL